MKEFKPVILFILKFLGVYIGLMLVYNLYLSAYAGTYPDPFTKQVAYWSVNVANFFGVSSSASVDAFHPWVWIVTEGKRTSYLNEGCNAISVILLYAAFIAAFSRSWKAPLIFIIIGTVVIQLMNVMRIFLLNYVFRFHPHYGKSMHDYFFPAVIYGTVFLFWMIWVSRFVLKTKLNVKNV